MIHRSDMCIYNLTPYRASSLQSSSYVYFFVDISVYFQMLLLMSYWFTWALSLSLSLCLCLSLSLPLSLSLSPSLSLCLSVLSLLKPSSNLLFSASHIAKIGLAHFYSNTTIIFTVHRWSRSGNLTTGALRPWFWAKVGRAVAKQLMLRYWYVNFAVWVSVCSQVVCILFF